MVNFTLCPLEKGFWPPVQVWASQNCRKKNSVTIQLHKKKKIIII